MMLTSRPLVLLQAAALLLGAREVAAAATPERKVVSAAEVLKEMLATPTRGIPHAILEDAEGVVIIPEVIKVGFIVGVQRGEGVVMVREENRSWSLPKFVTITAGSLGWQIGAESSDFVIVFKTRKGVQGLMQGKFTIGADANAAIGPVGRQIGAATDAKLGAEIYTYARSRGLFAGVSLAGSSLDIDPQAETAYYGSLPGTPVARVPDSATQLVGLLTQYTLGNEVVGPAQAAAGAADPLEPLRTNILASARALGPALNDDWRRYLALPPELSTPGRLPDPRAVRTVLDRFEVVSRDPRYRTLSNQAEFIATRDALARYHETLTAEKASPLNLPPPPTSR
jgi:SH3 domain-containing YSC84-like protein 1